MSAKKDGPPPSFTNIIAASYAWRWVPAHWISPLYYDDGERVYVRGAWESYQIDAKNWVVE